MRTTPEMPDWEVDPRLDWDAMKTLRALVPAWVVHRELAAETVLLNVETGHYFGMDEIGTRFFKVVSESASLESAEAILAAEYEGTPEQIRDDMVQFCAELVSLGLIELVEQSLPAKRR